MRRLPCVVCALLLVAYLATGLTLVRPGERAVVRRFGRVLPNKPGPGLFVGLPWGMDRVDRVPITLVRRLEVGYQPDAEPLAGNIPGQLLTGDHNLVNVRVVLDYAVDPDEEQIVDYVLTRDQTDAVVSRTAEAFLAEWVAGRKIDSLLTRGKAELPEVLTKQVQARLEGYHLGIQVRDASVAHLLPPDEVKSAFDEVTRAQTRIRTSEYQAQQRAAEIQQDALRRKYATVQDALAYADTQHRLAVADARRFDERRRQYWKCREQNPNALAAIWWDEMGRLFARMKENGRLDMLDNHLGGDGLDVTLSPVLPKRR